MLRLERVDPVTLWCVKLWLGLVIAGTAAIIGVALILKAWLG
jgi:hypothetical protein